jgi:protein TonB
MFEQTFVNAQAQTKRPWTVAASITLQTSLIGAALLIPLLHPGTIQPTFDLKPILYLTKLAPPPPPAETHIATASRRRQILGIFVPPTRVPAHIDMTPDFQPGDAPALIGLPIMEVAGLAAIFQDRPTSPPPPPPIHVEVPVITAPIRVSEGVQSAKLLFGPKPAYPQLAKAARVQGTVMIQALIATDGRVRSLQVISGPALLVAGALDAVRQWRYQPTLLNGQPVEVATEIAVRFMLN